MPTVISRPLPDPYYSTVKSIPSELIATCGVDEYPNLFLHFMLYTLEEAVDVSAVEAAAGA